MKSKNIILAIALGAFLANPFSLCAQDTAAAVSELPVMEDSELVAESAMSVDGMIADFLAEKGWNEGPVKIGDANCLIFKGTSPISAPVEHPNYINSRQTAFDKAMLDAKANMAKFIQSEISTSILYSVQENGEGLSPDPKTAFAEELKNAPDESFWGKCRRLAHLKLDNMLRRNGVDVDGERAAGGERLAALNARAEKLIGSSEFQKHIGAVSVCAIAGIQAFKTFEVQEKDGQGEIGVVAIWSPALNEMARSMATGTPVPARAAKKPIYKQLPKDKKTIISTFGVQQKINEKGELTLVSFGQAGALSNSKESAKHAQRLANLNAVAQLRSFMGEIVAVQESADTVEQTLDFGDVVPEYSNGSAFSSKIAAEAQKVQINGIAPVASGSAVHPINGKNVYYSIVMWNPTSSKIARDWVGKNEETNAENAAGKPVAKKQTPAKTTSVPAEKKSVPAETPAKSVPARDTRYDSAGDAGDEDAF